MPEPGKTMTAGWSRTIAAMCQEPAYHIAVDRVDPYAVPVQPDKQVLYRSGELLKISRRYAGLAQIVQELRD
ncbi:hypothetical protein IQ26_05067 [Mesorhizobium tianshanense]|uniref:Uncharacterized protein n=1 Tax=Mesorhizobium tianshanense TaxID=39844 RepID=A0A562NBD7_9HYPH|nr:hypothetical protein IQ26_05067 [Mesorhizobium tianshanense]